MLILEGWMELVHGEYTLYKVKFDLYFNNVRNLFQTFILSFMCTCEISPPNYRDTFGQVSNFFSCTVVKVLFSRINSTYSTDKAIGR